MKHSILTSSLLMNFVGIPLYLQEKNPLIILFFWILSVFLSLIYAFCNKNININFKKKEIAFLVILIFVAFFIRIYKIHSIPILNGDEARDSGLYPQKVLSGEFKNYWGQGPYGVPGTYYLLASIPHLIFGRTILSIRFFSAFFGFLSVLITYFLTKNLFNKKTAVISSIFLSCYHFHLHFSRSEFLNLFDSFWAPLIILTLFYAIKKDCAFIFGIVSGLSLHFYQGIRATVLISGIYWGIFILLSQRIKLKRKIIYYLSSLIGLIIGLGPRLLIIFFNREIFFNTGTASLGFIENGVIYPMILVQNTIKTFGVLFFNPLDFHYKYGGPLLNFPLNLLFVAGIFYLALNIKKTKSQILFLWITSVFFLNSIILESQNFAHRYLSLTPALMIICAVGLTKITVPIKILSIKKAVIALILIFTCIFNIKMYFFDHIWVNAYSENDKIAYHAGLYTSKINTDTTVYFLGKSDLNWASIPSWPYLKSEQAEVKDLTEKLIPELLRDLINKNINDLIFIVPTNRKEEGKIIIKNVKNLEIKSFYFDNELIFTAYEIDRNKKKN